MCKVLRECGDSADYGTFTFYDVVSSLLLEQRQMSSIGNEDAVGQVSSYAFRRQILDCHHLRERCTEEIELLKCEMKTAVQYYVRDIKVLQSIQSDCHTTGEIGCVRSEAVQQKLCLGILLSHFKDFDVIQLDELRDNEIYLAYTIDDPIEYNPDSEAETDSESDIE